MQGEVLQEQEKDLADYLNVLSRRKGLIASVAALIMLVSIALALSLPAIYKSTATILIEQQEVPQDFVRTLVTSFAEQRIQVISHKVMSTKNMIRLIEKYDLYKDDRKVKPIEVVVDVMRKAVSLDMVSADVVDPSSGRARSATIAFSLSFDNSSPKLAQSIVNEFVTLFLNENIKNRTETSIEASAFLAQEGDKLRNTISTLEEKLAEFKERNKNSLPELAQLNMQLMNRAENEILETRRVIQDLRERKIYLAAELAQQPDTIEEQRVNPNYRGGSDLSSNPEDRLEALQTEYLAAVSKYSEGHPDVRRLKREIGSLRSGTGATSSGSADLERRLDDLRVKLSSARERYSADHPDIRRYERELSSMENQRNSSIVNFKRKGSSQLPYYIKTLQNPAFIQLKAQHDAADAEIISLNKKILVLEEKFGSYEERLTKTPQVEREYRDLTRDFETATEKYREITAKQLEAQLSQSLESERKGERFTLIEPPLLPEEPFKPNRLAIVFLGLVMSLIGGLGAAAILEVMSDAVRGRHGVLEILGEAPLAVIPYIVTAEDNRKRVLHRGLLTFGALATAIIAAVVVHFYFLPLDIFWFKSLRKLGL